ncbi:MAG: hypothetical protein ACYDBQ_05315 [Thermoplasmatota archaeon]
MRTLVLALAGILLAGCVTPTPEAAPNFGWCPDWVQGPGAARESVHLAQGGWQNATYAPPAANATGPRNGTGWTWEGHPLDIYRVVVNTITGPGAPQLRASPADRPVEGLFLRDYKGANGTQMLAYAAVDASRIGNELDIPLGSVVQGEPPHPGALVLRWHESGHGAVDVGFTLTYFYRVCGA